MYSVGFGISQGKGLRKPHLYQYASSIIAFNPSVSYNFTRNGPDDFMKKTLIHQLTKKTYPVIYFWTISDETLFNYHAHRVLAIHLAIGKRYIAMYRPS